MHHLDAGVPGPRDEPVPQGDYTAHGIVVSVQKSRSSERTRLPSLLRTCGGHAYRPPTRQQRVMLERLVQIPPFRRTLFRWAYIHTSIKRLDLSAPFIRGWPLITSLKKQLSIKGKRTRLSSGRQCGSLS